MKKTIIVLNVVAVLGVIFGLAILYFPSILPASYDALNITSLMSITIGAFIYFVIKPMLKDSYTTNQWSLLSKEEKIQILADDLVSGKRYWAIRKYANTKYYFDPIAADEMVNSHLGTDPLKLRNLLRINQIENPELAEGILQKLGYWDPAT